MIYNLAQYVRTEFATETIFINNWAVISGSENVPDRLVLLRETGGSESAWVTFARKTVQIVCRDIDTPKARALSWSIYQKFQDTGTFGLILPANTVDSAIYAQVQVSQISALQQPESMGPDEEGRTRFVFNLQITYRRVN